MKKLIVFGLLSLGVLGVCVEHSYGFFLKKWFKHHCCNTCCTTTICLRQYNAFTPICFGNLTCDGCCPVTFGGCGPTSGFGHAPPNLCGAPWGGMPYWCMAPCPPACTTSGCCDAGCLPAPANHHAQQPPAPPAGAPNGNFGAPMPSPLPAMSYSWANPAAAGYYLQPAAYYPGYYYPGYYPNFYAAYTGYYPAYPNYYAGYYPGMMGYPYSHGAPMPFGR